MMQEQVNEENNAEVITAWEVIKYSPLSDKYPPGEVEPHIFTSEQTFKRLYFSTFWDTLVADLVSHGKLTEYDSNSSYSTGDFVIYTGSVFRKLNRYEYSKPL